MVHLEALILLACAAAPAAPSRAAPVAAPVRDDVGARIERGRGLLEMGRADEALATFEEAHAAAPGPKTQVWIVRAWIELGRADEALEVIDELKAAGAPKPDLDYLFGLAFSRKARDAVAAGSQGMWIGNFFDDAVALLDAAISADAGRFYDAHRPLAEAAWYAQDLPRAREAIARALRLFPDDREAYRILGRIAFSQYVAARGEEAAEEVVEGHWDAAKRGFEGFLERGPKAMDAAERAASANAHLQIGHLHLWKEDKDAAGEAYARAMGLAPEAVDLGALYRSLGAERFAKALEDARIRFARTHERGDSGDALLAWWQGYSLFEERDLRGAAAAFRHAVEQEPSYVTSWYYLYRTSYGLQDYAAAVEALRTQWESEPEALIESLSSDLDLDLQRMDFLVGWCANADKHVGGARNEDAAMLSEIMTRLAPESARYWNNLGLFLRDWGESLAKEDDTDDALLAKVYERALAAYERTLELEPGNPGYLNDTAVMLHYYLERDYERALEMYAEAASRAEELLAGKDLLPATREWFETALKDAKDNREKLVLKMEGKDEVPPGEDAAAGS